MSRASDLEAARLAKERTDARCRRLSGASIVTSDDDAPADVARQVVVAAAEQMLSEATYISEQRKSGWKSRSDAHTAAGRILEQWAQDLTAYLDRDKPPTRPPLEIIVSTQHADLDPADGPISGQIADKVMASIDAKLDAAFGPPWISAAYPGECSACGEAFAAGADIRADGDDGWQARECCQVGLRRREVPVAPGAPDAGAIHIRAFPGAEIGGTVTDLDIRADGEDKRQARHKYATVAPVDTSGIDPEARSKLDSLADISVTHTLTAELAATVPRFSEPGPAPLRQTQQRMTFEAVRDHGMARARGADHRSYSQASSFAECGTRYALSDLETPAWWNVGGTAVHYACEWFSREAHGSQGQIATPVGADSHALETLWTNCLNRSVSETITANPGVSPDQWRAAKKGSEGYDWWRTNGVDMIRRWTDRLARLYEWGWSIAEFGGTPVIEYPADMYIDVRNDVAKTYGVIKVENIIDLVMTRKDGALLIIDMKSGASAPDSTAQLGQYAHALMWHLRESFESWTMVDPPVFGAYWLARTGLLSPVDVSKSDTAVDLRVLHPWAEIEYLITTMHVAESQGLYLPNRTRWCGSCGVNGLCPVGPR